MAKKKKKSLSAKRVARWIAKGMTIRELCDLSAELGRRRWRLTLDSLEKPQEGFPRFSVLPRDKPVCHRQPTPDAPLIGVLVEQLVPTEELMDPEDRVNLPAGRWGKGSCKLYPAPEGVTEHDLVLDRFHAAFSIGGLEDFDIRVVKTGGRVVDRPAGRELGLKTADGAEIREGMVVYIPYDHGDEMDEETWTAEVHVDYVAMRSENGAVMLRNSGQRIDAYALYANLDPAWEKAKDQIRTVDELDEETPAEEDQ